MGLRIAVTADLHWGHQPAGAEATRLLVSFLRDQTPDLLILAGDVGTGNLFGDCLGLFDDLACRKALVPGNHDVWVSPEAERDSLALYDEVLPQVSARHGFHYLDHGPLLFPEADLAVVGTMNWYDYSWSLDLLRQHHPDELHRLESKRFSRGRHNDANFVRWPLDDAGFTARVVAAFERHLRAALAQVSRVVVVTHHPPLYDLGFPRPGPTTDLDPLLWDAFCGNRQIENLLYAHSDRVAFTFCGHTHRARECLTDSMRGYNVGGDYHFKRLLLLEWPAGEVTAHDFGQA
jgi:predicted phosphohydrolase